MLLDSNILIYGLEEGEPSLDAILDRSDRSVTSVSCLETLGFHRLSVAQKHWLETAISRMQVLPLDDATLQQAIALRQQSRMGCHYCRDGTSAPPAIGDAKRGRLQTRCGPVHHQSCRRMIELFFC